MLLIGILSPGSRVLLTEKIRVPGMLLTGIIEIGVLEVLLYIGVLLPSGPDNLAIGVPPVGEKAYFALALVSNM